MNFLSQFGAPEHVWLALDTKWPERKEEKMPYEPDRDRVPSMERTWHDGSVFCGLLPGGSPQ